MSLERSKSSAPSPVDATAAQPVKKTKKGATIILPNDVWGRIVPYVHSETLQALAFAAKTPHDAAVFRDFAGGGFSLMPTMDRRYFVELAKKDGYNAYF